MNFFRNTGIDDDVIINLDLVRKAVPGRISTGDTIRITYVNGDVENLRYKTKKNRDRDLDRMC